MPRAKKTSLPKALSSGEERAAEIALYREELGKAEGKPTDKHFANFIKMTLEDKKAILGDDLDERTRFSIIISLLDYFDRKGIKRDGRFLVQEFLDLKIPSPLCELDVTATLNILNRLTEEKAHSFKGEGYFTPAHWYFKRILKNEEFSASLLPLLTISTPEDENITTKIELISWLYNKSEEYRKRLDKDEGFWETLNACYGSLDIGERSSVLNNIITKPKLLAKVALTCENFVECKIDPRKVDIFRAQIFSRGEFDAKFSYHRNIPVVIKSYLFFSLEKSDVSSLMDFKIINVVPGSEYVPFLSCDGRTNAVSEFSADEFELIFKGLVNLSICGKKKAPSIIHYIKGYSQARFVKIEFSDTNAESLANLYLRNHKLFLKYIELVPSTEEVLFKIIIKPLVAKLQIAPGEDGALTEEQRQLVLNFLIDDSQKYPDHCKIIIESGLPIETLAEHYKTFFYPSANQLLSSMGDELKQTFFGLLREKMSTEVEEESRITLKDLHDKRPVTLLQPENFEHLFQAIRFAVEFDADTIDFFQNLPWGSVDELTGCDGEQKDKLIALLTTIKEKLDAKDEEIQQQLAANPQAAINLVKLAMLYGEHESGYQILSLSNRDIVMAICDDSGLRGQMIELSRQSDPTTEEDQTTIQKIWNKVSNLYQRTDSVDVISRVDYMKALTEATQHEATNASLTKQLATQGEQLSTSQTQLVQSKAASAEKDGRITSLEEQLGKKDDALKKQGDASKEMLTRIQELEVDQLPSAPESVEAVSPPPLVQPVPMYDTYHQQATPAQAEVLERLVANLDRTSGALLEANAKILTSQAEMEKLKAENAALKEKLAKFETKAAGEVITPPSAPILQKAKPITTDVIQSTRVIENLLLCGSFPDEINGLLGKMLEQLRSGTPTAEKRSQAPRRRRSDKTTRTPALFKAAQLPRSAVPPKPQPKRGRAAAPCPG